MKMEEGAAASLQHWMQLLGALSCPRVPLPSHPDCPQPCRAQSVVLGHLQVWGGCKGQTHPIGKGDTHLQALQLDLISKRCLSLNYCNAPLVSIIPGAFVSTWMVSAPPSLAGSPSDTSVSAGTHYALPSGQSGSPSETTKCHL